MVVRGEVYAVISSGTGTRGEDGLYRVITRGGGVVGPHGGTCASSAVIGVCAHAVYGPPSPPGNDPSHRGILSA